MIKLKIVVIGSSRSGKSTISNFLSDATDISGNEYRPTKGVRIVEFEMQNLNVNNRSLKAEIELWDCSGNTKYQNCWPTCYRDAQGIIFTYDPDVDEQIKELSLFYDHFAIQSGVGPGSCLVIEHSPQKNSTKPTEVLLNQFARVAHIAANVEESGNKLRNNFHNYIISLLSGVQDYNEREEMIILNAPFKQ